MLNQRLFQISLSRFLHQNGFSDLARVEFLPDFSVLMGDGIWIVSGSSTRAICKPCPSSPDLSWAQRFVPCWWWKWIFESQATRFVKDFVLIIETTKWHVIDVLLESRGVEILRLGQINPDWPGNIHSLLIHLATECEIRLELIAGLVYPGAPFGRDPLIRGNYLGQRHWLLTNCQLVDLETRVTVLRRHWVCSCNLVTNSLLEHLVIEWGS